MEISDVTNNEGMPSLEIHSAQLNASFSHVQDSIRTIYTQIGKSEHVSCLLICRVASDSVHGFQANRKLMLVRELYPDAIQYSNDLSQENETLRSELSQRNAEVHMLKARICGIERSQTSAPTHGLVEQMSKVCQIYPVRIFSHVKRQDLQTLIEHAQAEDPQRAQAEALAAAEYKVVCPASLSVYALLIIIKALAKIVDLLECAICLRMAKDPVMCVRIQYQVFYSLIVQVRLWALHMS
jgi:hypothetical protein